MAETPSSPRSRGGQPGNTNALKHGFYTRRLPGLKNIALEELDTEFPGFEEEIFMLRAYIRRTLECSGGGRDYHENVVLLRTVCLAFSTLTRLTREHRAMMAQPIDTLASLRQAHESVAQIQRPIAAYHDQVDQLLEKYPDITPQEYFDEAESCLPVSTFDRQPPVPFPTPAALCDSPAASPSPSTEAASGTQAASPVPAPNLDGFPRPTCPSPALGLGDAPRAVSPSLASGPETASQPASVSSPQESPAPQPGSAPPHPAPIPVQHPDLFPRPGGSDLLPGAVAGNPSRTPISGDPLLDLTCRINESLMHMSSIHTRRTLAGLIEQLSVTGPPPSPPPNSE